MTERKFVANPKYAGRKPEPLTPACHDRSPMLDVECTKCGDTFHIHETQFAQTPKGSAIGLRCTSCGFVEKMTLTNLKASFAELRRLGWIA
jgi:hypothetical protein